MEKIKENLGKIIITTGLVAAVFLGMSLFQMFDSSKINYVELIVVLLAIASCILLIVFGFKNEKIEKYLLIPFYLFAGSIIVADFNNIIVDSSWLNAFSLLFSLAIIIFYTLHLVNGQSIFKDILVALLIALSISHLVTLFNTTRMITSVSYLILSLTFVTCLLLHKKEETNLWKN